MDIGQSHSRSTGSSNPPKSAKSTSVLFLDWTNSTSCSGHGAACGSDYRGVDVPRALERLLQEFESSASSGLSWARGQNVGSNSNSKDRDAELARIRASPLRGFEGGRSDMNKEPVAPMLWNNDAKVTNLVEAGLECIAFNLIAYRQDHFDRLGTIRCRDQH